MAEYISYNTGGQKSKMSALLGSGEALFGVADCQLLTASLWGGKVRDGWPLI